MNRILFVKITDASFVVQDEEILKKHFPVTSYTFGLSKGIGVLLNQLKILGFLLFNIWKFNTIFIWFADFQSVIPSLFSKLLSKKSIIVLGGYDVAKIESISYGAHLSPIRSWAIKISVRYANVILPVSKYVLKQAKLNISDKIEQKSTIVYNAIDTDFFKYQGEQKQNSVVSVCGANDMKRAELKGVLHYIEIAKALPEIEFTLIGIGKQIIKEIQELAPKNLRIKQFISREKLRLIYNTSKVVCQLSTIESFGIAVAEAMACQCIPIVNNVGGLKEVVADKGYRVNRDDYNEVAESVKDAIHHFDEKCKFVDAFIQEKFSRKEREMRLLEIVNR